MNLSLRTRTVLAFTALAAVLVIAVSLLVYRAMSSQLIAVVDTALEDRIADAVRNASLDNLDADDDRLTQVLLLDGSVQVSSRAVPDGTVLIAVDMTLDRAREPIKQTVEHPSLPHRIRVLAEVVDGPDGPVVVVVARSLAAVDESRRRILFGILLSAPVLAGIISALGSILARRTLAPVREMSRRAAAIGPGDGLIDIGSSVGDDEFSELAESFNKLLARIAEARHNEQRFAADVSHELRTPLAIIRGELELLALDASSDSDVAVAAWVTIEEVDRMTNLVGRLLFLARAEAGEMVIAGTQTHLKDLVDAIVTRLPDVRDEIRIDSTGVAAIEAKIDAEVVTQILVNLLTNAVRHADTTVNINVAAVGGGIEVKVTDDGAGFSKAMLSSATQRFSKDISGSSRGAHTRFGLGLSIVIALAEACSGSARVSNDAETGGGAVTVFLPTTE